MKKKRAVWIIHTIHSVDTVDNVSNLSSLLTYAWPKLRSTKYHLKFFYFCFKNLRRENTIKIRQGKARSWKIGCKIFLFSHTLTDQLLGKETSRVKHWDKNLVEVDKGTYRIWKKGLCVSYPSPLNFFSPNEFIIILKKILHCVPYIPLESW